MSESKLEVTVKDFIENSTIKFNKSIVTIDGSQYRYDNLFKIVRKMDQSRLANTGLVAFIGLSDYEIQEIFEKVLSEHRQKIKTSSSSIAELKLDGLAVGELLNHESIPNRNGYIVYDKESFEVLNIDYLALKRRMDPEDWNGQAPSIPLIQPVYEPETDFVAGKRDYYENGVNVLHINLYKSPRHRRIRVSHPVKPPLIGEYLDFFFADKKSKHFAMSWMANALFNRSKTYMCLIGGEGAGKTTFAYLMERLIGEGNTVKAKEDFITNTFNDIVYRKRLVYIDEFHARLTRDTDILKSRIEDTVTIEAKHQKQQVVKNYASFILINNYFTSLRIDPSTGRKFSVPEITDKSILIEKGQDFIVKLYKSINKDNHIAHFYHYLKKHYLSRMPPHECFHGERYERITRESASEGMRKLIGMLLAVDYDEPIVVGDVRSQFNKTYRGEKFPTNMEIEKFFESLTVGGKRLGELFIDPSFGPSLRRHQDAIAINI